MSRYPANIITKSPATPTGPTTAGRAPGIWRMDDVAYWTRQGLWPNANIQAPDTYFPYVSLLLSSTSLSNANNNLFVDSSGAFNPVSRFGNTTQGAFSPYSTNWSNFFDGSGDFLSAPSNAAFDLGGGDFTIECWFNANSFAAAFGLVSRYSAAPAGWFLRVINATTIRFYRADVVSDITVSTMAVGIWYHVSAVRSGTTVTVYLNGSPAGTITGVSNFTDATGTTVQIGRTHTVTDDINGYISNVRVVKGTAVYTSNFTPPTAPLTAISGTSILTCQSNRFRDASSNNFTITPNGNTAVQDFGPFNPTYPGAVYNQSDITNWSGYFDGSGDYLQTPSNAAFAFGTGDYTVECWIYATSTPSNMGIYEGRSTGSATDGFTLTAFSSSVIRIWSGGALVSSSGTSYVGQWTHVAVTRASGTTTLWINGVSQGTSSTSYNCTNTDAVVGGGRYSSGSSVNTYFPGYISNFRIVKGTAVYTGAFTPPTSPLTAISGTSLLTCQNAAFTDNSTNNFVLTQNGNPTVTGNSPFNTVGYWSNYFDGTGDYLSVSPTALGTGDFTFECWIYATGTGQYQYIYDTRTSVNDAAGFCVIYNHASYPNQISIYSNGFIGTPTITVSTNTWTHFALVRSGGSWRTFVNGVADISPTSVSRTLSNTALKIGTGQAFDYFFAGYISNYRVVNGTALYTSNFTVPTAPLTAVSGTSLLTCQNGRFIDNSTNNFTITRNGDVSVQSFDPFYTATIASSGGSMYFNSTDTGSLGNILTVPASNALDIGAGDFTVECWVYPTAFQNFSRIIQFNNTWNSPGAMAMIYADTGLQKLGVASYDFGANLVLADNTYQFNTWYHIAVTRSSNVFSMFINGVKQSGTYTSSGRLWATTTPTMSIGNGPTSAGGFSPMQGYVSDVRIIKGAAIYTANFTPPTAPLTPTPATVLLANGMNAGIFDAATLNDMETVGNAQVSTAQAKFGGSSVYFDGSGDWLALAANAATDVSSGNFTVEAWVYPTSGGQIRTVYANWFDATSGGVIFGLDSTTPSLWWRPFNSASSMVTGPVVSLNTWSHIAVVRSGNTFTIYTNGVAGTPVSYSTNCVAGEPYLVGAYARGASGNYAGYIDDLRVTKGVARYTANFTPPTQPFPVY